MPIVKFKMLIVALLIAGMAILSIPHIARGQEPGPQALNPPSLPPAQGYSHVVIAPSGRLVSISGQVAIDSTGAVVGEGDFMTQCAQVFENLGGALRSAGLTFADVVRTDMFVTDLNHLSALRECRRRYLPAEDPPTSSLLKVVALFRPELMLEVAVEAVLPISHSAPSASQGTKDQLLASIATFDSAWQAKDSAGVSLLLAADYLYVTSTGDLSSRGKTLEFLMDPTYHLTELVRSDIRITIAGPVARVTSRWEGRGEYQGRPVLDDQTCGQTWVWQDDRWQLFTEHCVNRPKPSSLGSTAGG